jgi:hypothetical protein
MHSMQPADDNSRFSADMLARMRLMEEAKEEARLQAMREAEAKRVAAQHRRERGRVLRAARATAEEEAEKAGIRPGRLTISLIEAAIGSSFGDDGDAALRNSMNGSGRFFVTLEIESLEMTSDVIEGPDPAFQQLFTLPILQGTELHVQVWQEGYDTDGDILCGKCTVDIADFAYPRLRKPIHSKASGLGNYEDKNLET